MSWWKYAYVGQKVVCIASHVTREIYEPLGFNFPDAGEVYTIRYVGPINGSQDIGLLLEEIRNEANCKAFWGPQAFESGFYARNFKPLSQQDRDASLSHFRPFLNPKQAKEQA